jgi:hypothetical protein
MSEIIFHEENKKLIFNIDGYEFSRPNPESDEYTVNWLKVHIKYQDPCIQFNQTDRCLLTWELKDLSD